MRPAPSPTSRKRPLPGHEAASTRSVQGSGGGNSVAVTPRARARARSSHGDERTQQAPKPSSAPCARPARRDDRHSARDVPSSMFAVKGAFGVPPTTCLWKLSCTLYRTTPPPAQSSPARLPGGLRSRRAFRLLSLVSSVRIQVTALRNWQLAKLSSFCLTRTVNELGLPPSSR